MMFGKSVLLAVSFIVASAFQATEERILKYEKDIAAIENRLQKTPPGKDAIFFAGSSTIRKWNVAQSFPGMNVVNVGFGGSQTRDVTYYAPRILLPFSPKTIVFYGGDNDINAKRTSKQVFEDFKAFVELIHKKNPETKIIYLGIKPSIKRESQYEIQKEANKMVSEYCSKNPKLAFLDTVTLTVDSNGKPRPELFEEDGLHLNDKGYAIWSKPIQSLLK